MRQGLGFQIAMARAQRIIADAVINGQTQGYGYAELANIARNSLFQYRDMYLRPDYYEEQNTIVYSMIEDLIQAVAGGKPYDEALDEAYTRIYKSVDPSYEPNVGSAIDMAYLNVPAVDMVKFSRARKFLLEAIPKNE